MKGGWGIAKRCPRSPKTGASLRSPASHPTWKSAFSTEQDKSDYPCGVVPQRRLEGLVVVLRVKDACPRIRAVEQVKEHRPRSHAGYPRQGSNPTQLPAGANNWTYPLFPPTHDLADAAATKPDAIARAGQRVHANRPLHPPVSTNASAMMDPTMIPRAPASSMSRTGCCLPAAAAT
jgi:hypothetical protein